MRDGLYHKDIYIPPLVFSDELLKLSYTAHAIDRERRLGKGRKPLPKYINLNLAELVELEVKKRAPYKAVFRMSYDNKSDIALVIKLKNMTVITLWLNSRDDDHETLNREKYAAHIEKRMRSYDTTS